MDGWKRRGESRCPPRRNRIPFSRAGSASGAGPASEGKPVRFRVRLEGKEPGEDHGSDTDAQGFGTITEHRLYQLIRQRDAIEDRTFEIEFLDPGAQAFAFTFG